MSRRRAWLLSFVALTLVGVTWAAIIPLGGQPDEPAHMVKAAAVVRGEFTWDSRVDVVSKERTKQTHSDIVMQAPEGYDQLGLRSYCIARPPRKDASCAPPVSESTRSIDVANTYIAAYPPTVYLLMGLPTLWLQPSSAIYAARLIMVLLCATFLAGAFALAAALQGTRRTMAVGVVLAASPMALFLSSAPNPNALEVATSICVGTALFVLLTGRPSSLPHPSLDKVALGWFTVAGATLALTRPTSLLVLGFVGFWSVVAFATRPGLRSLSSHGATRACASIVALAAICAAWWFRFADPLNAVVGVPHMNADTGANIRTSFGLLPTRAEELIGRFGWGDTDAPRWVQYGWLLLVLGLVITALAVGTWRHRGVLVALIVTIVVLPTAAEIPRVHELGFIWFGRYWLPFAITVPLVAAGIVASRPILARVISPKARTTAVLFLTAFVGAAQWAAMATGASRFAAGSASNLLAFVDDPPWSPEIGPTGSFVLITAAAVLYAVVVGYLLIGPGSSSPDDASPVVERANNDTAGGTDGREVLAVS